MKVNEKNVKNLNPPSKGNVCPKETSENVISTHALLQISELSLNTSKKQMVGHPVPSHGLVKR